MSTQTLFLKTGRYRLGLINTLLVSFPPACIAVRSYPAARPLDFHQLRNSADGLRQSVTTGLPGPLLLLLPELTSVVNILLIYLPSWHTEPAIAMDATTAAAPRTQRSIHRLQVYVHVEVGVSLSNKDPTAHSMTYRSRGLREKLPTFPCQVSPPATNYFQTEARGQQRRVQLSLPGIEQQENQPARRQRQQPQLQYYHQPQSEAQPQHSHYEQSPSDQQRRHQHQPARRSHRDSRSSYERGRSEPPRINDIPGDAEQQAVVASSSSLAWQTWQTAAQPPPQIWKALPETPSRFRLGEDGMPWESDAWPGAGHDTPAEDSLYDLDDLAQLSPGGIPIFSPETSEMSVRDGRADNADPPSASTPIIISSPVPHSQLSEAPRRRDQVDDPGRVGDLERLSAAMMTVDNGFEHQWWNQDQRTAVQAVEPEGGHDDEPPAMSFSSLPCGFHSAGAPAQSLGWAVATNSPAISPASYPTYSSSAQQYVVSPTGSPSYMYSPPLNRTLSTRSEELSLTCWRYA